jgi:hypothetical protein
VRRQKKMQKKVIAVIVAVLVIAAGGSEIAVAWEDIDAQPFEGDMVNGKGETSHHEFTGAELSSILADNGEMLEGIEGGQGAQLVVFGDPNSKRAVRYMKTVTAE